MAGKMIYLDNAATTALDNRVVEAMLPYFQAGYGNASSLHSFGLDAKNALDKARITIAESVNAQPDEVVFTSSGTESNNLALKGIAFANTRKGRHIIVSRIEHDSILQPCSWLENLGFNVTCLDVDAFGVVDLNELEKAITPETVLVSIMHANNEIGTIQDIAGIGKICSDSGVLFHTDACQSYCKTSIDMPAMNIDLLSLNAHKIHGPKSVGALIVRNNAELSPLFHGGGQENGLRSSTENIPGIVGFASAVTCCMESFGLQQNHLKSLRDSLIKELSARYDNFILNGHPQNRLVNNVNFSLQGMEGDMIRLLLLLDKQGIAISTGSACSNNESSNSGSHVLKAIGRDAFQARGAIRVSFGRFNDPEDITVFLRAFENAMTQLKPIFC